MASSRKRLTKWNAQSVAALSDDELIQVWAQAFADRSVLKEGDLTIENRIKHGAPPESIDLLLQEAERRAIPLATLANRVVAEAMAGKSFISTLVAPPSWRRYEKKASHAITTLLRSEGLRLDRVEFDARVKGRITGEDRQVDLLLLRRSRQLTPSCSPK